MGGWLAGQIDDWLAWLWIFAECIQFPISDELSHFAYCASVHAMIKGREINKFEMIGHVAITLEFG